MQAEKQNKVAMITGAAGALGSQLAMLCARAAWETVLVDKDRRGLESLYDCIVHDGATMPSLVEMDFAGMGPQDCANVVNALQTGPGRLDALVHCAAGFDGLQPLDQIQPHDWLRLMQVNLNAPWLLSVLCLPLLRQSPDASLIFISEDLEKVSAAYWGSYGVSKHGINCLARQFASELGNSGVQVLAINPGPMRSPLRARAYYAEDPGVLQSPATAANKILRLMERSLHSGLCQINLADLPE